MKPWSHRSPSFRPSESFRILPGAEVSTEPAVIGADAAEVWKLRGHMCLDRPIDL